MKRATKNIAVTLITVGIILSGGFFSALAPSADATPATVQIIKSGSGTSGGDSGGSSGSGSGSSSSDSSGSGSTGTGSGGSSQPATTGGGSSTSGTSVVVKVLDRAAFNNHPSDKETLRAGNISRDGANSTDWQLTRPVQNGELVSFVTYYHNTSYTAAQNTRISLALNNDYSGQKVNISGKLWADNADQVQGAATLNVEGSPLQPWALQYQYAKWYPDLASGATPGAPVALPNGQDGSSITSAGGVNIGTVTGPSTAGFLVAVFKFVAATNPQGELPAVETQDATNITHVSATLHGYVDPKAASATYWFEYGKNGTFNQFTTSVNITSAGPVSATVGNLDPQASYSFRLVAQNANGTARGDSKNFTTLARPAFGGSPLVQTLDATALTNVSATINASVDPNGYAATYWFEYSTSPTRLTNMTSAQFAGLTAGSKGAIITGLAPSTTYYFRIAAQNEKGKSFGAVLSFTTKQSGGGQGEGAAPLAATKPATNIAKTSARLNGSVDSKGLSTTYWFEYGTSQNSLVKMTSVSSMDTTAGDVSATVSGLTAGTVYYFRIAAENAKGTTYGQTLQFTTITEGGGGGGSPIVQTQAATGVAQTSATLRGQVNPNGSAAETWFEYGTSRTQLLSMTALRSIGTAEQAVQAVVAGLAPSTTYYFRIAAQNEKGKSFGSILQFTTLAGGGGGNGAAPEATTRPATAVDRTSARLQGTVDPNGLVTTYAFEYSTSPTLETKTITAAFSAGSGDAATDVSAPVAGLSENTTYYFRIVASNEKGTATGAVLSFTTTAGGNGGGGGGSGGGGGGGNPGPLVTTDNATAITETSATLYGSVHPNLTDATAWFEYGTSASSFTGRTSEKSITAENRFVSFSAGATGLSAGTKYYYRAVARNRYGSGYGQVKEFTTFGTGSSRLLPTVQVLPATNISRNAALLNGNVNLNNNGVATAWFEYGDTAALGRRTFDQTIANGSLPVPVTHPISGLLPNTDYFFRIVARNQYGTAQSSIFFLRTLGSGVVPSGPRTPVVVTTSGAACVLLVPTLDNNQLDAGQEFVYTITYRNTCSFDITNAYMKVILPTEVEYISSNYPISAQNQNDITYSLGTIPKGTPESAITINGKVLNSADKGDVLIFSSVLNFEDAQKRPQSVSAYLTADVISSRTLTATILDAFRDLFSSWWFSLLLLLAVLFLIFWIFFRRRAEEEEAAAEVDVLKA